MILTILFFAGGFAAMVPNDNHSHCHHPLWTCRHPSYSTLIYAYYWKNTLHRIIQTALPVQIANGQAFPRYLLLQLLRCIHRPPVIASCFSSPMVVTAGGNLWGRKGHLLRMRHCQPKGPAGKAGTATRPIFFLVLGGVRVGKTQRLPAFVGGCWIRLVQTSL